MPNEMNNILTLENDAAIETQKSKEDLIDHQCLPHPPDTDRDARRN